MTMNGKTTNSKLLVKMQNSEGSLERVIAKVRESHFQVRNLSARLSIDESIFFLTLEVEGEGQTAGLTSRIGELNEVKTIEVANPYAAA